MKKLLVVLAVALLTGGMVAALLWQRVQDERYANAALQARVGALKTNLPATTAPGSAATPVAAGSVVAEMPAPTAAPTAGLTGKQIDAFSDGMRRMMTSPEGREITRANARLGMARRYPHLGAELGLSPAEVDQFYDLLARQQADLTVETMNAPGDVTRDSAAMQELLRKRAELRQSQEAEITAALGEKYPRWTTYQQSLPLRRQVAELQSLLGGDNDALSDAQARPLVATLAAEQARIFQEQRNAPGPSTGTREQYQAQQQQRRADTNRRLLEAAAAHLTPQQLASYRRMLEQEQERDQRMEQLERAITATMETQPGAPAQAAPATATPR